MKEKHFKTNLIILGDLIAGDDGCADVKGSVTWGHLEGQTKIAYLEQALQASKNGAMVLNGDFNIAGQQIFIDGNLLVYGEIRYDQNTYKGHIAVV